jgi:DNA repair ATPase RecN
MPNEIEELHKEKAKLKNENAELLRKVANMENIMQGNKQAGSCSSIKKVDDRTFRLEEDNRHLFEVVKYLERKLKDCR